MGLQCSKWVAFGLVMVSLVTACFLICIYGFNVVEFFDCVAAATARKTNKGLELKIVSTRN